MAVTGLLALVDDITTILDDIAAMSKIATQKTIGIAGDDLAVNAEVLAGHGGIDPKRELPIVWAVAKGSFRNKAILIPAALGLNAIAPWTITPLLMVGGAYLCYEGIEKVLHSLHGKKDEAHHKKLTAAVIKSAEDLQRLEKNKIKQAINTDLILSAEIVTMTLGAVAAAPFLTQLGALTAVGLIMTVGIYGLVGGIVKLDDIGLHLAKTNGESLRAKMTRAFGNKLVTATPSLMKGLSVVGTAAMFAVGGGIILHGVPAAGHLLEGLAHAASSIPFVQGVVEMGLAAAGGIAAGFATLGAVKVAEKPFKKIAQFCTKTYNGLKKNMFAKTRGKKNAEVELPLPAVKKEAAPEALKNIPNTSTALNTAASPDIPKQEKPEISQPQKTPAANNRHSG